MRVHYRKDRLNQRATHIRALRLGGVAVGAMAIGAVAIGRLAIVRSRSKHFEIDELVVGNLRVTHSLKTDILPIVGKGNDSHDS